MRKEIHLDFNTLLWSSNSWSSMYLYITNFKSRIYKATRQKLYKKKYFLQKRLLASPTAKIFASLIIINADIEYHLDIDWYSYHNLYSEKKTALSLELYLLSQKKEEKHIQHLNTRRVFLVILVLFVLEPEFTAKQDKAINIVHISTPKFAIKTVKSVIQNHEQKLYLQNINFVPYLTTLNLNSLMTKLSLSSLLSCILKSNLNYILNIDLIKSSDFQKLLKYNNLSNHLSNIVFKFLTYILVSEVSYIVSSYNLYTKLKVDSYDFSISVINYGYEILVYHSHKIYLKLWQQVFFQIAKLDKYNQESNNFKKIYLNNSVNFLGYYFIVQKNILVGVEPSKDSQILLFRKINLLFLKLKSNSAISLIHSLNHLLKEWGSYFIETKAKKVFVLVDYLIYLKIRSWMLRNHPNWGRLKIMSKYFFVGTKYSNLNLEQTHRLFYTKQIVNGKKINHMLIRLKDLNL